VSDTADHVFNGSDPAELLCRSTGESVMRAAVDGLDMAATLAEGHELDTERAARVLARDVGRMLSPKEAAGLLDRIDCGQRLRGPGKKH
jgi:hypothetical protein